MIPDGFKIVDAKGQTLAYVYGHADPRDAGIAKSLTLDEARRIASNIRLSCQHYSVISEDRLPTRRRNQQLQ